MVLALCTCPVSGQRVGLVLSGGGAKGIAHIGVIQALEENGIPIDYVTGTSIGAIIGGLYAMGYTPAEMMSLIKSSDFINWMNGTVEERYIDFFRKPAPTPEIISTDISLKDTAINAGKMLPTSLMDPIQMNFAFLQLTAQYTALCNNDFDKLFVPYRSIAADVYQRKSYVFREGDLGDAIRASMTFPFVFKAIKVDGHLLYDGGIYNNFPIDIMIKDFDPDVCLGSVVVDVNQKPDDYDMVAQLQTMIMHPSNYDVPQGKGFQMQFDMEGVSLLDFYKADSLYRIGYEGTIARIDSIKSLISRRTDPFDLRLKRNIFKSQIPVLRFRKITVNGVNEAEREYIFKVLRQNGDSYFMLEDFKIAYFKLLADNKVNEIIPHAIYDPKDESFQLVLDVEMNHRVHLAVGANVSSSISNQLYLGVGFHFLSQVSQQYSIDAYMGRILNAIRLKSVFFSSDDLPKYASIELSSLNFNMFQGEKLFYKDDRPAFIKQHEVFLKLRFGLPLLKKGKVDFGLSGAYLGDKYMQTKLESFSEESFDKSAYALLNGSVHFEQNSLNTKQYPTGGGRRYLTLQLVTGIESYLYPDTVGRLSKSDTKLSYAQLSGGFEQYLKKKNKFILGFKGEAVYNNKRSLDNYTSSIIQAPAFSPTIHSKTTFNEAYRSNQYLALGILPIWNIRPSLFLRTELYGYFPLTMYQRGVNQEAVATRSWSNIQYIAEASLVYSLNFTTLSVFVNNYSYPDGNWNFGVNIGYLLFGSRFIE